MQVEQDRNPQAAYPVPAGIVDFPTRQGGLHIGSPFRLYRETEERLAAEFEFEDRIPS